MQKTQARVNNPKNANAFCFLFLPLGCWNEFSGQAFIVGMQYSPKRGSVENTRTDFLIPSD
jgi:hypothetical protein